MGLLVNRVTPSVSAVSGIQVGLQGMGGVWTPYGGGKGCLVSKQLCFLSFCNLRRSAFNAHGNNVLAIRAIWVRYIYVAKFMI